ncbi:YkgJ family cysteine cluster protein [Clostridium paraputrificum]|uniref:YkgJ family cysteine cluster protein n=1 Tax=Clostridium paraputrificum TaxID=29363 RepID=UPI00137A645A|nr:YkgJ family cysteine cluster protein [Clostridium paraputrificum]MDB2115667.1 YkgJ family cysteine cluster protein [Clostridium paraputrificum]
MKKDKKCFCGNSKCTEQLHKDIKSNSKYSKTFKLYKQIDKIIEESASNLNLNIQCKKGCSECCHQVFSISEVEFCIIADYLLEHLRPKINDIFEKSNDIYNYIKDNDPLFFNKLSNNINGNNPILNNFSDLYNFLLPTHTSLIPHGCIFLNNNNECSIYKVRPVICRTHGVSYCSKGYTNILCSKLEISDKNRGEFVDLTSYENEVYNLFSFKQNIKLIIRAPFPMFHWFCFLKENHLNLYDFRKTLFYSRYTRMSESEMIDDLVSSINSF